MWKKTLQEPSKGYGYVYLPKEWLREHQLNKGDELLIEETPEGDLLVQAPRKQQEEALNEGSEGVEA